MGAVVPCHHHNRHLHFSLLHRLYSHSHGQLSQFPTCIPSSTSACPPISYLLRRVSVTRLSCRALSSSPSPSNNLGRSSSNGNTASVLSPSHMVNRMSHANYGALVIGISVVVSVIIFVVKPAAKAGGSVADLVKRGQLRSDRRSDSKPLKYEDPFNNPMVKTGPENSVVKMYGKMFRLQPISLTEEKMLSHQNRRVQAYQWRRPSVFLVEGEPIPEGTDPDSVRWIPSNHPFATTKSDIDEVAAEKNVYQTRGVPSRVRAEHEALRKSMMEAIQKDNVQLPVAHIDEGKKAETQQLSEELENGLRPIKPFDRGDYNPYMGMNDEEKRAERPFQQLSEQAETGVRPIKPFDRLDTDLGKLKEP